MTLAVSALLLEKKAEMKETFCSRLEIVTNPCPHPSLSDMCMAKSSCKSMQQLFGPIYNHTAEHLPALCFAKITSKAVSKYDAFFIMLPFTLCSPLATMMQ